MIASTKSQNVIVLSTIIVGLVSGVYLVSNGSYYAGSYAIARNLSISLEDVLIANLDPSNESINPGLTMVFNIRAPDNVYGKMTLTYLMATISLNGDSLALESFHSSVGASDRTVTAAYNKSLPVGSMIIQLPDKQLLYNASQTGNWTFIVTLTITYYLFQSEVQSRRVLVFAHEGYTVI